MVAGELVVTVPPTHRTSGWYRWGANHRRRRIPLTPHERTGQAASSVAAHVRHRRSPQAQARWPVVARDASHHRLNALGARGGDPVRGTARAARAPARTAARATAHVRAVATHVARTGRRRRRPAT